MKLSHRPDVPPALTDTLNTLIEAHEAGAIQAIGVATIINNRPDFGAISVTSGAQALLATICGTMWLDQQLGVLREIKVSKAMQAEPVRKGAGLVRPDGGPLS